MFHVAFVAVSVLSAVGPIMSHFLFAITMLHVQHPAFQTTPVYVDATQLQLSEPTVAFFTHCSRHFDPLGATQTAVRRTAATMKAAGVPVLYLHDRYNPQNPCWKYLYDDWEPTAFVSSDIGHFETDFRAVQHVICLGGYFGQCERATVSDAVRLWQRDGRHHNLRVTQITDGIFTVGEHLRFEDAYAEQLRRHHRDVLKSQHPMAVLTLAQIIAEIQQPDSVVEFLQRQLPANFANFQVNVVMDVFGRIVPIRISGPDRPVLTFAYRTSADTLEFQEPEID